MFSKLYRKLSMKKKRALTGYLFISPFLIGLIAFFLLPVVKSILFSFSEIELQAGGYRLVNVQFQHYHKALYVHPKFLRALVDSVISMVTHVPLLVIFSFFTATLINQRFKGRGLARAIIFLPVIMTSGIIFALEQNNTLLSVMRSALSAASGEGGAAAGTALRALEFKSLLIQSGIDPVLISYLIGAIDRIYDLISASGVQVLIFLAGLQSIPASVFEASNIEGATSWENFWKITFPMISPLILVNIIYTVIDSFTQENNEFMRIVRETAFKLNEFGYSAAMSWMYFVFVFTVTGIITVIISKRIFYYE